MAKDDCKIGQTVYVEGTIYRKEMYNNQMVYYLREAPGIAIQNKDIVWSPVERIERKEAIIRGLIGVASGLLGAVIAILLFII